MTRQEIVLACQEQLSPRVFHYYRESLVVARAKGHGNGLLVGKGGLHGNVIRITPPPNISRDDVDAIATRSSQNFARDRSR